MYGRNTAKARSVKGEPAEAKASGPQKTASTCSAIAALASSLIAGDQVVAVFSLGKASCGSAVRGPSVAAELLRVVMPVVIGPRMPAGQAFRNQATAPAGHEKTLDPAEPDRGLDLQADGTRSVPATLAG